MLAGEICDYIEEVYLPDDCFILLKINAKRVRLLQLEITMSSIAQSICNSKLPVPVKPVQVCLTSESNNIWLCRLGKFITPTNERYILSREFRTCLFDFVEAF